MSRKQIITAIFTFLAICLIYIFPSIFNSINSSINGFFSHIKGEQTPDSNIVLVHISENDIENLGDWPLKRSYYALLINSLTELEVSEIGVEIFLSSNIASQNIYNDVLNSAIENSKNVVLASLLEDVKKVNDEFSTTKINFPNPKISLPKLASGHINFIEANGVLIPHKAISEQFIERSFAEMLADTSRIDEDVKVNFISDWRKFKNYSLLEFFDLLDSDIDSLKYLKNKIVIIGVSDPLIAKTKSVIFNEELPGIAIHAFALDNILNNRSLDYEYLSASKYLFFILALLFSYLIGRKKIIGLLVILSLFLFYIFYSNFFIELNYSALLFPLLTILFVQSVFWYRENKVQLDKSVSESELLKSEIKQKEEKLNELKNDISRNESNVNEGLKLKIGDLVNDINNLKKNINDDNEEFVNDGTVKNFEGIVYRSSKMEKITQLIKKVAPETASVLIMGESGSGKELIANAIHNLSERKENNFVAVNCAALPDNLLESELFGHVKGAFTDAIKDKIGRFEEANNGTLFLDEIGETSENFQVKLLRVLQSGDYQKVGSSETQHANVRIVAATNKNLHNLVKEGKFREDLFYRLNVIIIEVPSLVERKEDIEIIANHFAKLEDPELTITKSVMKKLIENEWKGNIRELQSTIKRAAIFSKSEDRKIIKLKDLPEELSKISKEEIEELVMDSLREKEFSHSSIIETAKELGGISRTSVSENYRGSFFKTYSQNNFDLKKSIKIIANTEKEEILTRVETKVSTFLSNIEKDLGKYPDKKFIEIKEIFGSKYKNLPQKYHEYLDLVIKNLM